MKATVFVLAIAFLSCVMISRANAQMDGMGVPVNQAWWDDRTAGLAGGIGGSVIGLMGATIGTLAGIGRGRSVVFALLNLLTVIGAAGIIAGVVALSMGQPYAVWYPLVLSGAISLPLSLFLRPTIRKRFEAGELARMQSMDVK